MMSFESKNFNLLYNNVLILIRISLFSASLVFILHFSLNWLERASIGFHSGAAPMACLWHCT